MTWRIEFDNFDVLNDKFGNLEELKDVLDKFWISSMS